MNKKDVLYVLIKILALVAGIVFIIKILSPSSIGKMGIYIQRGTNDFKMKFGFLYGWKRNVYNVDLK